MSDRPDQPIRGTESPTTSGLGAGFPSMSGTVSSRPRAITTGAELSVRFIVQLFKLGFIQTDQGKHSHMSSAIQHAISLHLPHCAA